MNLTDFLFEKTKWLEKELIGGSSGSKSYREISNESFKLARYLRRKIGQKQKILLVAGNGSFFISAYLGIIKSGNICVPLNPSVEREVLEFIIDKTGARLGFLTKIVSKRLKLSVEVLSENDFYKIVNEEDEQMGPEQDFNGDEIAEIIFTSGSTALPKGVMLSHNNIIANTKSIISYLDLTDKDIMMVVLPFYYCYGLSLLHTHIYVGGSLILNNSFILLGSTINDLNKYYCTGFAGVPSHFQILLRKSELFKKTYFPSLRYVTQAGGKLYDSFIKEFTDNFPEIKFYVMYGQTEATSRLSYLPPELLEKKMGSIGKGIPDVELQVADEFGKQIKPGEEGEIRARGKNVMEGYYEDSESTAMTLKDGWLYTGDLATVDSEGFIYITGRKKEIIKVGGYRISPKEIEEVIVSMDGVIDCTVGSQFDELIGEAIKVTVVLNEKGKRIKEEDVKYYCSKKLPYHKIPVYVDFTESLEFSPVGKKIRRY